MATLLDVRPKQHEKPLLTPAQVRCARLAAIGAPRKIIAAELGVSEKTVSHHLADAYKKLKVINVIELARRMMLLGDLDIAEFLNPDFFTWKEKKTIQDRPK